MAPSEAHPYFAPDQAFLRPTERKENDHASSKPVSPEPRKVETGSIRLLDAPPAEPDPLAPRFLEPSACLAAT
jgi:hypothetical protein